MNNYKKAYNIKKTLRKTDNGIFLKKNKVFLKKVLTKRFGYDILTEYKEAELSVLTYEAIALHGQYPYVTAVHFALSRLGFAGRFSEIFTAFFILLEVLYYQEH